jgi:hypothetical protein
MYVCMNVCVCVRVCRRGIVGFFIYIKGVTIAEVILAAIEAACICMYVCDVCECVHV